MSEYIGYEVELVTTRFGTVTGVVSFCDDIRIDLTNIKINGQQVQQSQISFNSDEISNIKVLSTSAKAQNRNVPEETPKKSSSSEIQRERLKNMPGAITAYVCDKSPPRVFKTPIPQRVTSSEDLNRSFNKGRNSNRDERFTPTRFKNKSFSHHSDSAASGFESDTVTSKNQKNTGGRSRAGGKRNYSRRNDCFSLRVEDFPDADFDFEANLAKFDKESFDAKIDKKKNGTRRDSSPEIEKVLFEGPDGICYVPASAVEAMRASTPVKSNSQSPAPNASGSQWFTPCGKKVPYLAPSVLDRALQFLSTGRDYTGLVSSLPMGLTWTRMVESVGQALVNTALLALKQPPLDHHQHHHLNQSQGHHHHQQPVSSSLNQSHQFRVLVLPGKENFSGAIAINIARHFANRDAACVLLYTPPPSAAKTASSSHRSTPSITTNSPNSFAPFYEEFILAQTLCPQSSSFLQPTNQSGSVLQDSSDDEESVEEELACSFTADHGDVKYSIRRLWTGKIPGLILVTKSSTPLTRLPTTAHIDLLVLGQPLEDYPAAIRQWLEDVKGVGLAIQLGALRPPFRANFLPSQSQRTWVIQLGLPVASPLQVPQSLEVYLVDVGLNRWVLSRVADKRSFPPPGLFETSSCIRLVSGGSLQE